MKEIINAHSLPSIISYKSKIIEKIILIHKLELSIKFYIRKNQGTEE